MNLTLINNFLFSPSYATKKSELDKAKEIADQLISSIYWLKQEAEKQVDHLKKSDLLMEVTAAERELDRINTQISKAENNN